MTTKKTQMHDTTLTFRLPKVLHEQLEQIANAQYLKMGELVRNLIKDEIKRAHPYITAPTLQQKPTGKPVDTLRATWEAMSPAERKAHNDEWDY